METVFLRLLRGKRYYAVRRQGEEIFVGTRQECARFLEIHAQKVRKEQEEALRTPRARPYVARVYRNTRLQA